MEALSIEPVVKTSFMDNLRNKVSREKWGEGIELM
jgi:hypothetical protein